MYFGRVVDKSIFFLSLVITFALPMCSIKRKQSWNAGIFRVDHFTSECGWPVVKFQKFTYLNLKHNLNVLEIVHNKQIQSIRTGGLKTWFDGGVIHMPSTCVITSHY